MRGRRNMTETIRYAWGQSSLGDFVAAASERGIVAAGQDGVNAAD